MLAARNRHTEFSHGTARILIRPWNPNGRYCHAVVAPRSGGVNQAAVNELANFAQNEGFVGIVTGALAPQEQLTYIAENFFVREELHVLYRDITRVEKPAHHTARANKNNLDEIIKIDNQSFEPHWQLDKGALSDARHATAHNRLRIAIENDTLLGYALTGRTGRAGYLQRLAITPSEMHKGYGRSLVADSLRWLRRWGANTGYVNTQLHNKAALGLYQSLGFVFADYRLSILQLDF